jgi:plastocyanin
MGGSTPLRTWLLIVLAAALWAAILLPSIASSETPTIEARSNISWKPPSVMINTGGEVKIVNHMMGLHGVEWKSGPTTPSCTAGVPVGTTAAASGENWEGNCTFSQAGTYEFWCTVHKSAMKAIVTVGASGPVPAVKKLSPKKGPAAGGTSVTVTGSGFTGATAVNFGAVAAAKVTVTSDTSIMAVSPAEPKGMVDVTVTGPGGKSAVTKGDRFRFVQRKKK